MNDNYPYLEAVSQFEEVFFPSLVIYEQSYSLPPESTSNLIPFRLNLRAILFLSASIYEQSCSFPLQNYEQSYSFPLQIYEQGVQHFQFPSIIGLFYFKGGINEKN